MIELFEFQRAASESISDRFIEYRADPVIVGTAKHNRKVPFFQALASLTASGKTIILADAVSTMSDACEIPPVVLWLSKGKVVVEQSLANLLPGGKYHHLLGGVDVRSLGEFNERDARESTTTQVFFATVGTFNQKDKEEGNRLIYKSDIDNTETSTWDLLRTRLTSTGQRRLLLVVYDEAHNLTDAQTDRLTELEPDAFLLASATMRLPSRLHVEVEELRRAGKGDEWLTTRVDSKAVADSGLVKSTLLLGGYRAPMEETVSALLADMKKADKDAAAQGMEGRPKAMYVCNTNMVESNAFQKDEPKQPFNQRQAPPIVIWRYLTGTCGIDPSQIAVYASLNFNRDYPPPPDFVHFKGGDKDYDEFSKGNYRHIIFNLGLQEGWDDPLCYFAYIDKSMESRVQVEQLIGRVLRQPGARRYAAERLNTAHFYIRVDRGEVWDELLAEVESKLNVDSPEIRVLSSAPGRARVIDYEPKSEQEVPTTAYNPKHAVAPIEQLIDEMTDYRSDDGTNTRADGSRTITRHHLGDSEIAESKWENFAQSNLVSARWVFQREVRRRYHGALQVASTADPKFDARVGVGSKAYLHVAQIAERTVDAYLDNVELVMKRLDPYVVGSMLVKPDSVQKFTNSLHAGYDGLNGFELDCALVLDKTGLRWCRNPSRTGYGIPLITIGSTSTFYPDFLVWKHSTVFAIDTKGGHVLHEATARKLLRIEPPSGSKKRLLVGFISKGKYSASIQLEDPGGFSVWQLKQDGTRRVIHVDDLTKAVDRVLRDGT